MNWPPLLLRLRIANQRRRLGLWLPLFLVWVILAVIAIPLVPLVLIAALILWPFGWGKLLLLFGPAIFRCLCALHGLEVDVKEGEQIILVSFK